MEGLVARWYAKQTLNDLKRHTGMAKLVSSRLPPGARVLEIAPGPGYFCIELAKLGDYQITGLDISQTFVEIAKRAALAANVSVDFRHGNASAMPFQDAAFDFTFCQAAFKNFAEPVEAINEMHRVLAPNGLALIVDLRKDAPAEEIGREVDGMHLTALNAWFTKQSFRWMLLRSAYTEDQMRALVGKTPFIDYDIHRDGIGFQLWLRK